MRRALLGIKPTIYMPATKNRNPFMFHPHGARSGFPSFVKILSVRNASSPAVSPRPASCTTSSSSGLIQIKPWTWATSALSAPRATPDCTHRRGGYKITETSGAACRMWEGAIPRAKLALAFHQRWSARFSRSHRISRCFRTLRGIRDTRRRKWSPGLVPFSTGPMASPADLKASTTRFLCMCNP